jgi:hypothetical protein
MYSVCDVLTRVESAMHEQVDDPADGPGREGITVLFAGRKMFEHVLRATLLASCHCVAKKVFRVLLTALAAKLAFASH